MSRPVWADKGNDAQAVAAHLEQLAATATQLRFAPVPLPSGADTAVLHQAALLRVRKQLAQSHAEADRILAQEVRAIDDLVRSANLLVERLREWYALHAPEATRLVSDPETLAKLVNEKGDRTAVLAAVDQANAAASSLGSQLDPADMAVLRGFAAALQAVHESWRALENRVNEAMQTVAPNVAATVGPLIGARMIALSGGLNRLATWPAGTVQLLGAETALFRHIKEGSKPPKHGILFQHPKVHQSPQWQRGPIARVLALAAAKAAKADAFTKNDLRPLLEKEVADGIARVQRERAKPPVRKAPGWQRNQGPEARRAPQARGRAGPPRDGRGPPPRRFDDRGPARQGGGFGAPRGEAPQGAPGGFGRAGPPREGGRAGFGGDAPRDGGRRFDDRGPPREGGGGGGGFGRGPPRDGPRDGPRGPPPSGWKPKRKPAGAFRGDGNAAKPPSRGDR